MTKKKWALIAFTVFFFASIAVLTFTAKSIRESMLPHVTAARLTRENFSVQLQSGVTVNSKKLAIPKDMLGSGELFIVAERVVNGEKRTFAQKINIKTGLENDGFFEVTGGLLGNEFLILTSDRPFSDGDEVLFISPNKTASP